MLDAPAETLGFADAERARRRACLRGRRGLAVVMVPGLTVAAAVGCARYQQ